MRTRAEHEKRHHDFAELAVADEKTGGTADLPHSPEADERNTEQINDNYNPVKEFKA
jgi:hypothetical protein